jgi:hypothetical protein
MWLKSRPDSTGKLGAVGFCFGGGIVNQLAVSWVSQPIGPRVTAQPPIGVLRRSHAAKSSLEYARLRNYAPEASMGTEGSNLAYSSGESCRRSADASTTSQCAALSGAGRNHERRHRPTSAFGRQERRCKLRTLPESAADCRHSPLCRQTEAASGYSELIRGKGSCHLISPILWRSALVRSGWRHGMGHDGDVDGVQLISMSPCRLIRNIRSP